MSDFYTLGYVEVPIKVSGSGYITKHGSIPVVGDDPRHYPPLIALALNPDMIDFIINHLPYNDGFTDMLKSIRDEMKEDLWKRYTDG